VSVQHPHTKLINAAARDVLRPMGIVQKGRSRLWYDNHGWWAGLIEFQPVSTSAICSSSGRRRSEWRFFDKGKRDLSYQHPVIMGFDVPNPKYNVDLPWAVRMYAYGPLNDAAEGEEDAFVSMVEHSVAQAPST
jgi:hypothetical protein